MAHNRNRASVAPKSLKLTPFLLALLILTVLVISRVHSFVGVIRAMRPAVLLVLLAGGYAFIRPQVINLSNISKSWPPKIILGLAVTACLSIPFGISIGRAGNFFVTDYAKTVLYALLLVVALRETKDVYRVTWAFVLGAGMLAFESLFIFGISKTQDAFGFDANDVGLIMVTGLPLTLLTLQTSRKLGKILSLIILLLVAATIARSQSRGAFVGLLMVGLALLATLKDVALVKRLVVVAVAAVAVLFAAPPGYWKLMDTIQNPQEDYNWSSTNGRRELVKRGLGYMSHYPLFGVGIHNFELAEATISDKAKRRIPGTGLRWAAPHNSFIQAGAEMGVPGLILWALLPLGGIYYCLRLARSLPKRWKKGAFDQRFLYYTASYLPIALIGFAVSAFFVSFAYLEPVYILAILVTGLQVFSERALKQERSTGVMSPARRTSSTRRITGAPTAYMQTPLAHGEENPTR